MHLASGRKPEHENRAFCRVRWLQPATKATSCVRMRAAVAVWIVFARESVPGPVFCNEWLLMLAQFFALGNSLIEAHSDDCMIVVMFWCRVRKYI